MKITYLLGAGASAGGNATTLIPNSNPPRYSSIVPVVAGFNKGLIEFLGELEHVGSNLTTAFVSLNRGKVVADIKRCSVDFVQDLELHHSIDTLARKYYVKYGPNSEQLRFLKFSISAFLIYRQYKHGVDPRYDLFFAAIGDRKSEDTGGIKLPDSVSILSWNYDNQVELSLRGFSNGYSYVDVKKQIGGHPWLKDKGCFYPKEINLGFNFLKLNGSADLIVKNDNSIDDLEISNNAICLPHGIDYKEDQIVMAFAKDKREKLREHLQYMFHLLMSKPERFRSLLCFSWEEDSHLEGTRNRLVKVAKETQVLVVIGYSFPTFNRKMDRLLANSLSKEKLKKIYVQVKPDDYQSVRSKLIALFDPKWQVGTIIEHIPQVDEFYVPYELDDDTMHQRPKPIKMKF